MSEYINVGKKILKTLNNNGYEAYFVGESVRNSILKKAITRVDITTNATLAALHKLFDSSCLEVSQGTKILKSENYLFYIYTFKTGDSSNIISAKHYSKNLLEDLSNRDFTINAIAMSYSGKLTDAYNGYQDIIKKRIKHIGKAKIKFKEHPEWIIKSFALMSELGYSLSRKTKREINRRKKYLVSFDVDNYIDDFIKVFNGVNARKAILMMNKTNVDTVLPVFKKVLRLLGSHYKKVGFQDALLIAFLLNGEIDESYNKYIDDYNYFIKLYNLCSQNKTSNYDEITLFTYGLELCLKANVINNILRRCPIKEKKIRKKWKSLRIKTVDDLLFNRLDVERIIHPKDYYVIDDILVDVSVAVIAGEIKNTVTDIQSMVINLLNQNNIRYSFDGSHIMKYEEIIKEQNNNSDKKTEDLDIINKHLINQQKRSHEDPNDVFEKDNQNKKVTIENELTSINLDFINENEKIKELLKNDKEFEKKLKNFISQYIENENIKNKQEDN